jgi:hypothetical protein
MDAGVEEGESLFQDLRRSPSDAPSLARPVVDRLDLLDHDGAVLPHRWTFVTMRLLARISEV